MIVKKYSNRRLYDTVDSRYITLEELTHKIRSGTDATVVDAQTGADLTQATLTQIILESRGGARLLPIPLLTQLIRMGDEALAEFFGRYMTWALEIYMRARTQAQALSPYMPLATVPFSATNALARMVMGNAWGGQQGPAPQQTQPPMQSPVQSSMDMPPPPPLEHIPTPPPTARDLHTADDLMALRRELDALRETVQRGGRANGSKRAASNGKSGGKSGKRAARAK